MQAVARRSLTQQLRLGAARRFAHTIPESELSPAGRKFLQERQHVAEHAGKSGELWRRITIYVAIPSILVGYLNARGMMKEHEAHLEHIKEENGGELPERVVYHFNIRNKIEFPWGTPNTLFYNPHVNVPAEPEE
ncbi:Cytochrome c oxidase subunit 6A [Microbotryomycetes sp. JL221]|nr:Cytochrome c oxidase subunit 6A [Microbotryomycetes sp. JL221]